MLILQITDIHLTEPGGLAQGLVDTAPRFEQVCRMIANFPSRPDLLLITGDLADNASPEAYDAYRAARTGIDLPVCLVPGNHDDRDLMRAVLDPWITLETEFLCYVVDDYPLRLIGLDTLDPGHNTGRLCVKRLHWLDHQLAMSQRPTLIFMHHPPFRTHIEEIDALGLAEMEAFADILSKHPHVKQVVCGHFHRPVQTMIGTVPVTIAQGVGFEQAFGLGPDGPHGFYPGQLYMNA